MMAGTVHVVGGGVAGLAAAVALLDAGRAVCLHEATPGAGGRARALSDGTDNGTHALLGANRAALAFLRRIDARDGWVEPEPDGLPVLDLADGRARRVALNPLGWVRPDRRPPGLSAGAVAALARMALPARGDRTVAAAMGRHSAFLRGFVEPLTIAALNTPAVEASARRLRQVLMRLGRPGATRLFVARDGLGPDLVQPALRAIAASGGEIRFGSRLTELERTTASVSALRLGAARMPLGPADAVVLATPPWETARLLPGTPVPTAHAPIVNLHFARAAPGPIRFLGLLGALCQWVLVRPTGVSVTISAGDAEAGADTDTLAPRAWAELRQAALAFGLPGPWPEPAPPCRLVKERRATPRHGLERLPPAMRRPLPNLALAGDWSWEALPATIDAAIRSGQAAAALLGSGVAPVARLRAPVVRGHATAVGGRA